MQIKLDNHIYVNVTLSEGRIKHSIKTANGFFEDVAKLKKIGNNTNVKIACINAY
jgi:hypothetical protein